MTVLVPENDPSVVVVPETTVVTRAVEKTEVVAMVAEGPQGPPGSYNGPQITVGPTEPSDTSLLWVKTPQ